MSLSREVVLTCPKCGGRHPFTVWDTLNATVDPDQKKSLLKGDLFSPQCGTCGQRIPATYSMLYHDMEQRVMIWLVPPETPLERDTAELFDDTAYKTRNRRVDSVAALLEKIRLVDAGLDDKIVELLKLEVTQSSELRDRFPPHAELLFLQEQNVEERASLVFTILNPQEGGDWVSFPQTMYENMKKALSQIDLADAMEPGPWPRVDRTFASRFMEGAMHRGGAPVRRPWWKFW